MNFEEFVNETREKYNKIDNDLLVKLTHQISEKNVENSVKNVIESCFKYKDYEKNKNNCSGIIYMNGLLSKSGDAINFDNEI